MLRIALTTLLGLVAGAICAAAAFSAGILEFTPVNLAWVLMNRAVMGFAIGASGLRLRWAWNGAIVGLLVGSIYSYFLFMRVGLTALPMLNALANGIFGVLIEFLTTVVFKQPATAAPLRAGSLPAARL